jgi:hypothetical protein
MDTFNVTFRGMYRYMRRFSWTVMVFLAPLLATAPIEGQKPAWRWTEEERLAKRFDAAARTQRVEAAKEKKHRVDAGFDFVDGTRDPDLFLPWELTGPLLRILDFPALRQPEIRAHFRGAITAEGWDPDAFWIDIEVLSARYRSLESAIIANQKALAKDIRAKRPGVTKKAWDAMTIEHCEARADMLDDFYEKFGTEAFDRFLYTAVAPTFTLLTPTAQGPMQLRKLGQRCK